MMQVHILKKTSRLAAQTRFALTHNKYTRRAISQNTSPRLPSNILIALTNKLKLVTKQFDSVLGISEVRYAQRLVETAEDEFMKSRRNVQETRNELVRLQNQLRDLRSKLDRIPREDERYLQLATEEHKALVAERKAKRDLETLETLERDHFSALSAAVRGAHEKERSRAERTKYWSIIASACGAVLGILGSTIINMKRMNQIRLTIHENNNAFITKTMEELQRLVKHEQLTTSSETPDNPNVSDKFLELLNENSKKLHEIDSKVKTFPNEETIASKVEELLIYNKSNFENPSSHFGIDRRLDHLTLWSKASFIATVISSACLMFYVFSKELY